MELIANGVNGNYLQNILNNAPKEIEWVKAAVAYASGSPKLIDFCVDNSIPLQFWGRLDESIPVSTSILDRFLRLGPSYECKLVWRFYHPKVIWFADYGAYIGSSNLNDSSWTRNIECGVWLSHSDLEKSSMLRELELFFDEVDKNANPLTEELLAKLIKIEDKFHRTSSRLLVEQKELSDEFSASIKLNLGKSFDGLTKVVTRKDAGDRRRLMFLEEWNSTITILRKIADLCSKEEHRPIWVKPEVPKYVQMDQFLHAYYYTKVKVGNRSNHDKLFELNKSSSERALGDALSWWGGTYSAPSDEDEFMYSRAPYLAEKLSKKQLLLMRKDELPEVLGKFHAFVTAARQTTNEELGLPSQTKLELRKRADIVANWMWDNRTGNGSTLVQALNFILYGGPFEDLTSRMYEMAYGKEWHIPRFGIGCVGEAVGWAMQSSVPARNGRTSKALRALGFPVKVYSD